MEDGSIYNIDTWYSGWTLQKKALYNQNKGQIWVLGIYIYIHVLSVLFLLWLFV